jgi:serine/threonine protein kinase
MNDLSQSLEDHVIFCPKPDNYFQSGTRAELLTVKSLVLNLFPQKIGDYRILVNYNIALVGATYGTLEVDILLINKFGVFLLEVKDWSGVIEAYGDYWVKDQHKHRNPLLKINDKAKVLHSQLSDMLGGATINVKGAVVLAKGKENFISKVKIDKWKELYQKAVVGLESSDLIRLVNTPDSNGQELSNKLILEITENLYKRHQSIPQIIVDEKYMVIGDKPKYRTNLYEEYEAIDMNMPLTSIPDIAEPLNRVRIKVYRLDKMSKLDQSEIAMFRRSAEAVKLMGYHENIVYTQSFFPDRENPFKLYEITELLVGRRLDEILSSYRSKMSLKNQLQQYLIPLARALERAHNNNIVHRFLSPTSIFVNLHENIKLDEWNYARIQGAKTILVDNFLFKPNYMSAPEIKINPSFATPASDVFSLGALWFVLASLPMTEKEIDIKKISTLGLSPTAQMLLSKMLSQEIKNRPSNAGLVLFEMNKLMKQL